MQKETRPVAGAPLTRLLTKLRGNKRFETIVFGSVIALAVLLYALSLVGEKKDADAGGQTAVTASDDYAGETERRLTQVLSSIRGAGKVEVMITYETGKEIVAAMRSNTNTNASESSDGDHVSTTTQTTESTQPATIGKNGADEPLILMEKNPTVRGVVVVAEGAADVRVKLDLLRAVQAALDIPLSRIEVFERTAAKQD